MSATETTNPVVDAFNRDYPVGAVVRYWTGVREGAGKVSTTRTTARMLGGHTPVVWVADHGACIALTHVQPEQCPHCTSDRRGHPFVMPTVDGTAYCIHSWHDHDETAVDCGCVDCELDDGWNRVAERMDRWAANGYAGDWQDAQYNEPTQAGAR